MRYKKWTRDTQNMAQNTGKVNELGYIYKSHNQNYCILHAFIPLFSFVFSRLMVEFINNVPKERLTKQKLKCIDDLVHSDLFKYPGQYHCCL